MAVKDGIERRHVSLPAEDWATLDRLADEAGVPRHMALRAVVSAGLKLVPPHSLRLRVATGRHPEIAAGHSGGRRG